MRTALGAAGALALGAALVGLQACSSSSPAAGETEPAAPVAAAPTSRPAAPAGAEAFLVVHQVFLHPRCMNCHPAGDAPLQGDDSRPHAQGVVGGPDGRGRFALKCANCHPQAHLAGEHMPPGDPNWRLPPRATPMVFQGRSPAELARQLKDPAQTGGKDLAQLLEHLAHDSLVSGCWSPVGGRTPPPVGHAELVASFRAWVEQGAPVPA